MKRIAIACAALLMLASVSSCKKCVECTYDYGAIGTSTQEACGKKSEVNDWKQQSEAIGATCKDV